MLLNFLMADILFSITDFTRDCSAIDSRIIRFGSLISSRLDPGYTFSLKGPLDLEGDTLFGICPLLWFGLGFLSRIELFYLIEEY